MRKILAFALFLGYITLAVAQSGGGFSDVTLDGMFGPVKTVRERVNYKVLGSSHWIVTEYDRWGNKVRTGLSAKSMEEAEAGLRVVVNADAQGRKVRTDEPGGGLYTVFTYDQGGRLIIITLLDTDGRVARTTSRVYDEAVRRMTQSETWIGADGTASTQDIRIWTLSTSGRLASTSRLSFSSFNSTLSLEKETYDNRGFLIDRSSESWVKGRGVGEPSVTFISTDGYYRYLTVDAIGNWTSRDLIFSGGINSISTTRSIIYW